ncbi:MAG: beta-ketoacyl-[acyl-carrier-protein] synthase II, partial [Bacteroidetes bacterium]
GGLTSLEAEITDYAKGNGVPRYNPFLIPKMIIDIAAGLISIKYGFRGANFATVSACASASHAIATAYDYVRLGRNDIVVTGGSEAAVSETGVGGFNAMKALSTRNDDYKTASRPFDRDRDGLVPSGGAATVILESYESAVKRGARILAEVIGYGFSSNGDHISVPNLDGPVKSMQMALKDAGLAAKEIEYINAHATSTPVGDAFEAQAIHSVFGDNGPLVSSTKSMTGHECWMAGASEVVYSLLMMQNGFVAPNINFSEPDEASAKLNIPSKSVDKELNTILSNSFGFGGTNSTLIIRKFAP